MGVKFNFADPLTSRRRFATRKTDNYIRCGAIVVGSVIVFSWLAAKMDWGFPPMLVADLIALGVAYSLFNVWDNRPIKFRCPACQKPIFSNRPWICGLCGEKNTDTVNFPFLYRCKSKACLNEPKSFRCPYCTVETIICLTEEDDKKTPAVSLDSLISPPPEPNEHDKKMDKLRKDREALQAEREIAMVQSDLNRIQKIIDNQTNKKTGAEESIRTSVNEFMEKDEAIAKLKAEYAEKYKNDPAMRRRMLQALKKSIENSFSD